MPSGAFPTPGFTPGNYPPKRREKVRYVCAATKGGKQGCREFVNLSPQQIKAGRIPRCKCGAPMKPAQKPQKPHS